MLRIIQQQRSQHKTSYRWVCLWAKMVFKSTNFESQVVQSVHIWYKEDWKYEVFQEKNVLFFLLLWYRFESEHGVLRITLWMSLLKYERFRWTFLYSALSGVGPGKTTQSIPTRIYLTTLHSHKKKKIIFQNAYRAI